MADDSYNERNDFQEQLEFQEEEERKEETQDGLIYFHDYVKSLLNLQMISDDVDNQGNFNNRICLALTPTQRTMIVQWLGEICDLYSLSIDTFSLSVYIFDQYLYLLSQTQKPLISQFQLIASASLLIAAKYEERYFPAVSEFEYMCDRLYKKKEIINMETTILKKLNYKVTRPDARFNARLKLAQMKTSKDVEIEPIFFDTVDFVYQSSLFSSNLTFADIDKFGDTLIDTTGNQEINDDTPEKKIKMHLLESLEIANQSSNAL